MEKACERLGRNTSEEIQDIDCTNYKGLRPEKQPAVYKKDIYVYETVRRAEEKMKEGIDIST